MKGPTDRPSCVGCEFYYRGSILGDPIWNCGLTTVGSDLIEHATPPSACPYLTDEQREALGYAKCDNLDPSDTNEVEA